MRLSRRATLVANDDDLRVLTSEAKRRKTSLGRLLGELVGERATEIRRRRRPRVGTFSGNYGLAQGSVDSEDAPAGEPFRSE